MKKVFRIVAVVFIIIYCYRELPAYLTSEQKAGQVGRLVVLPVKEMPLPKVVIKVKEKVTTKAKEIVSPSKKAKTKKEKRVLKVKNDVFALTSQFEDEFLICVAYTEYFKPEAYKCRHQWLVGYGQAYVDGVPVRAGDSISIEEAKKEVIRHLRVDILPKVNEAVTRPFETEEELLSCCLLAYNMGTGGFAGSGFVKALNAGQPIEECFKLIKGTGGVRMRRWVDIALFTGAISPYDLKKVSACGCYNFRYRDLYNSDGTADLSAATVNEFLTSRKNQVGKKLVDIM